MLLKSIIITLYTALVREPWPETSAQEIGWFTASTSPSAPARPLVHSELTQYMSAFWRYHPPPTHAGLGMHGAGFSDARGGVAGGAPGGGQ